MKASEALKGDERMKNIIENEMGKLHDALPKDVQHNIATMTDEEWTEYRKSQIKKRQATRVPRVPRVPRGLSQQKESLPK